MRLFLCFSSDATMFGEFEDKEEALLVFKKKLQGKQAYVVEDVGNFIGGYGQ